MKTIQAAICGILVSVSVCHPALAEKSVQEWTQQAEAGQAEAQFELGRVYLRGRADLPADPQKAFDLMKQAADQDHPDAIGAMGYFYAEGVTVPRDEKAALDWFRKGAEAGSLKAKLNLGLIYLKERGAPAAAKEAERLIRDAADGGLAEAQATMAELLFAGEFGGERNYAEVLRYAQPAAEAGIAHSQNLLGTLHAYGQGVKRDTATAEVWYRKAAEKGDVKAQSNLGILLGVNHPKTRLEALTWLMMAERKKDVPAKKILNQVEATIPPDEWDQAREAAIVRTSDPFAHLE